MCIIGDLTKITIKCNASDPNNGQVQCSDPWQLPTIQVFSYSDHQRLAKVTLGNQGTPVKLTMSNGLKDFSVGFKLLGNF